jgi:hypothetical protein
VKIQVITSIGIVLALAISLYFCGKNIDIYALRPIIPYSNSMFNSTKLIIIPIIIYILLDILIFKKERKYVFESYISGLLCSLVFYICSYYTYRGIVGDGLIYFDYAIYFVSLFIIFVFRYKKTTLLDSVSSVVALIIILLMLIVFSYYPSNISIFN